MLLPLLSSAVLAAAPASAPGDAASVPTPTPPTASAPAAPAPQAAPTPTIDSILRGGSSQSSDTDEDSAPPAPQGPVPYNQIDGKAYDDALRSAAAAARAAAGPLDGGWTLATADGHNLYRFQFLDRGLGFGQAEGAWRNLEGGERLRGSGFVDQVGFTGEQLMLRFRETQAADDVVVTVKPNGASAWTGQLYRHGAVTPVTFRRDPPLRAG
jgi:hypothetical protein